MWQGSKYAPSFTAYMRKGWMFPYSGWKEEGQKGFRLTNFSPVTSTNVEISPKTFLAFTFCLFTRLVNYWIQTKINRQKRQFFCSNPYKIEVMITSPLEMLEFCHMTISTIYFESSDKILLVTSWAEIMASLPSFENSLLLRGTKAEWPILLTSSKL